MLKEYYSFYIGGMGARGKNFYNDLFARYGYEAEAREIQELFLDGKQREAAAAVPDAFVDEVALVGSGEQHRRPARRVARVRRDEPARLDARRGDAARGRRGASLSASSAVSASSGTPCSKIARARVLGAELAAGEASVDRLAEHGRLPERERLEPRERLDVAAGALARSARRARRATGTRPRP